MNILPKGPLTNVDLLKYAKLFQIPNFRGVFMRNKLPKKIYKNNECGIINLDDCNGPGTHWTAYKKSGKQICYFDSYGNLRPPVEALNYFQSNGPSQVIYNYDVYQVYNEYICGHLCIIFLYDISF